METQLMTNSLFVCLNPASLDAHKPENPGGIKGGKPPQLKIIIPNFTQV